jgi:hypothetical protein
MGLKQKLFMMWFRKRLVWILIVAACVVGGYLLFVAD